LNVPAPEANESTVTAPLVAVIAQGPSKLKVAEYAPFASVVVFPEPFLQVSLTVALANAAPIAAVPPTVPNGGFPLEPPPPHATIVLVRKATDPNCSVRRIEALRSFIHFLQEKVMHN
jgi:hypothetical protein